MEKENKVEEQTTEKTVQRSLNESIIKIRVDLQNSKIKKSGKNKFANFDYFELSDFLPRLNELMLQEGINDNFKITNDMAALILIKGEEKQEYTIPFVIFDTPLTYKKDRNGNYLKDKNGEYIQVPSMQDIQYLGALNTYYKRYLYLNAFGVTDGEIIDSMDNNELKNISKEAEELQLIYIAKMNDLVNETNSDYEEIFKYFGVKSTNDMDLNQLKQAVAILEKKKSKNKEEVF